MHRRSVCHLSRQPPVNSFRGHDPIGPTIVCSQATMADRLPEEPRGPAQSLIGRQLGAYQMLSLLGVGGMGEVYRARDTRLQRDVAIKVLPHFFASDPERLRRFEREALLLAALNHPHIGAIYGVEDVDGVSALVLELVDGETLADRVRRGPVPLGEALTIAHQLADALDAAHERGIIHRDLKPANIKITTEGVVKVLDFGLARIDAADGAESELSQSPTVTVRGTREGVILGTAAYMSPEQTRGRPLDKRTDVWSFGCVLYEMLAGHAPFAGETVSDTIAGILGQEPEWRALPETTPTGVRRLLQRCLEKDRKRRLRDIGDARMEIEALVSETPGAADASTAASSTSKVRRLSLAVGVLGALLAVSLGSLLALLLRKNAPPSPESVRRFSMELGNVRPVISPDGRHIAYRSDGRLWIRDVDSETPREIPGGKAAGGYYSDAGYYLTWSPDSQDLAFTAENELRRVSALQGGSATTICALPPGRPTGRQVAGMAWSNDGETIVFSRYGAGIYAVAARAGSPTLLWKEDHADDVMLFDAPQGRAVVFAESVSEGHALVVRTPDGERRVIAQLETNWPELVYSPSGHVLYRRNPVDSPSIWALPFSPRTLTTDGEPFLVERAGQGMSLSQDGTLAYLDAGRIRGHRLAWRDRAGKIVEQSGQTHESIESLSLSPDGNRAVVMAQDATKLAFWLYDVRRFVRTRLELGSESEGAKPIFGIFSRSGDEIYYSLLKTPTQTLIFARPADGFGQAHPVPAPEGFKVAVDRTADGRYVIYVVIPGLVRGNPNTSVWLWRNGAGGNGEAINFSQNSANEGAVTLSPNGRYAAYTSTISGRFEVYVRPFPEGRGRWQISVNGGQAPAWRRDGQELFFTEGNTLTHASVSTGGQFAAGPPEPLFEHPTLHLTGLPVARYAVGHDGQRFLTVESERDRATPIVRFVQNWLSEFSRAARRPAG
jgi:eukaryotic-like serine/threonine-protein kinase